jgi:hypothetical protein
MRVINRTIVFIILTAFVMNVFANQPRRSQAKPSGEAAELNKKIRRFAPTIMTANTARLSPTDRKALQKIIAAAKLYALYLRQIWSGNESLWKKSMNQRFAMRCAS